LLPVVFFPLGVPANQDAKPLLGFIALDSVVNVSHTGDRGSGGRVDGRKFRIRESFMVV